MTWKLLDEKQEFKASVNQYCEELRLISGIGIKIGERWKNVLPLLLADKFDSGNKKVIGGWRFGFNQTWIFPDHAQTVKG